MRPKDFANISAELGNVATRRGGAEGTREVAHIRSVQAQIDALSRGDVGGVLRQAHRDVELQIFAPLELPWISRAYGVQQVRDAIAHNFDTIDQQRPEILNVLAEGDVVVLIGRERGIIRATAEKYDLQFVERFTFRDGRLAAIQIIAANTAQPSGTPRSR